MPEKKLKINYILKKIQIRPNLPCYLKIKKKCKRNLVFQVFSRVGGGVRGVTEPETNHRRINIMNRLWPRPCGQKDILQKLSFLLRSMTIFSTTWMLFNRPSIAGAVLRTPSSLIHSSIQHSFSSKSSRHIHSKTVCHMSQVPCPFFLFFFLD